MCNDAGCVSFPPGYAAFSTAANQTGCLATCTYVQVQTLTIGSTLLQFTSTIHICFILTNSACMSLQFEPVLSPESVTNAQKAECTGLTSLLLSPTAH